MWQLSGKNHGFKKGARTRKCSRVKINHKFEKVREIKKIEGFKKIAVFKKNHGFEISSKTQKISMVQINHADLKIVHGSF